MLIRNDYLCLSTWSGVMRGIDNNLYLALFPKWDESEMGCMIPVLLSIDASWNWLPRILQRRHVWPTDQGDIYAARWTGMVWEPYEVWWPFRIRIGGWWNHKRGDDGTEN